MNRQLDLDVSVGLGYKPEKYGNEDGLYSYIDPNGRAVFPMPYFHRSDEDCLIHFSRWCAANHGIISIVFSENEWNAVIGIINTPDEKYIGNGCSVDESLALALCNAFIDLIAKIN